jgi:hypothetical protein
VERVSDSWKRNCFEAILFFRGSRRVLKRVWHGLARRAWTRLCNTGGDSPLSSRTQIIQKKRGSARGCAQQMLFIAAAAVAVVGSAIGGAIYYYRNYYRKINISDNLGPALG